MHIVLIGTKAQLIKMAPVMLEMERQEVEYMFVLTGQHNETMQDLILDFGLRQPDDVWASLGEADTKVKLLNWVRVAWKEVGSRAYLKTAKSILVHGDTLSTLLGAVVGKKFRIPVMHIEAGLRSFNYFHPFPEELIRIMVSKLSSFHFCPGDWAESNLIKSGVKDEIIINTESNTLLDSLRFALKCKGSEQNEKIYAVVSLHRHENLSNNRRFSELMEFVCETSKKINLKFILHPVTKLKLKKNLWNDKLDACGVELLDRSGYVDFIELLGSSRFLITDGGSNQEEASYLGLPCLIMRKATERTDGINKNAILSKYDDSSSQGFIEKHLEKTWNMNCLSDYEPSKNIVKKIKKFEFTNGHE